MTSAKRRIAKTRRKIFQIVGEVRDVLTLPRTVLHLLAEGKDVPKNLLQDAVASVDEVVALLKQLA